MSEQDRAAGRHRPGAVREPPGAAVLDLQGAAGNAATALALGRLAAAHRSDAGPAGWQRPRVQRQVAPGLAAQTAVRVVASGADGVLVEETQRRIGTADVGGYLVRLLTTAVPRLYYQAFFSYDQLDPAVATGGTPTVDLTSSSVRGGEPRQTGAPVPTGSGPAATHADTDMEEEDDTPFEGNIDHLPATVVVGGVTLTWISEGNENVLKPTSGGDVPHLTFVEKDPIKFHLTTAEVSDDQRWVTVSRKGYAWNGMRRVLVDDPHFPASQQRLPVLSVKDGYARYEVTGASRRSVRVAVGVPATAMPSADKMAAALSI
ncbi:hypothetical protein GCM10010124_40930 [Pilimelia terevasa]|uniref:Uncharacterized protein n=2 Tax=Pilimelia terevasa TaxID=53372 RepID=A0A8J3BVU8_9ACTN|nr:hypothetical protein GCM10010124_40930 [Pilimelia terevasa]